MRDLGTRASGAGEARIVGNLAGVVEWANDAFAHLSGIGLDETVDKPVGRLLERAGIDLEIVEFVAQHFFEGRVCRVAFPFERPDGRRIDVLLEVEALRDAVGEIDRFMATAREDSAPHTATATATEPATEALAAAPSASAVSRARRPSTRVGIASAPGRVVDLEVAIRRGVEEALAGPSGGPSASRGEPGLAFELGVTVELDLADGLFPIAIAVDLEAEVDAIDDDREDERDVERAASESVGSLVAALFEAARLGVEEAGNAGGAITLSTARLAAHRRFVSKVHAIAACPAERTASGDVVIEVHDTGLALSHAVVAAIRRGDLDGARSLDASARVRALTEACTRARALGARIHLDSTPGCGNQLIVLFAPAPPA